MFVTYAVYKLKLSPRRIWVTEKDAVKFVGANTFKFEFGFYTFYIGNREHK